MLIVQRNFRTTHITRTGLEWETNDYVGKTTVKSSSLGSVSNFLNTLRCRRHKTRGSVGRNSSPRKPANALHSLWKDNRHDNNKQHSERLLPAPRERYAFISKTQYRGTSLNKVSPCNNVGHKISTPCSLRDYLAGSFDFAVKAHVSITLLSGASHH